MPAEVLYRKWRPQRFADVSGQEPVKRTLMNALKAGRVSHAYLFSGPRGTGKTTMGRLLTKAINCERNALPADERPGEPCNECASCTAYNEGRALDLIELDGASNRGIEEIRKLRDNAGYAPMAGASAHKVYLIDEVHMLTDQAFNALLKTLEEPPPHVVFILATTDAHRVPATIISRCQRQDFKRIPVSAIADRLEHIARQEGLDVSRDGLELIARTATGSLRDAINLLEQICDAYGVAASIEAVREGLGLIADERAALLARKALQSDLAGALATIGEVRDDGLDLRQFQREVVAHLRDALLVQAGAQGESALTPEEVAELRLATDGVPRERIVELLKLLSLADLKQDPLSPLPLELALAESLAPPAPRATPPASAPSTAPRATVTTAPPRTAARPTAARAREPFSGSLAPSEQVPAELKRDNITGASPEEIARMVGSDAPIIPAASESNPVDGNGSSDLATFVDSELRPRMKASDPRLGTKLAALVNGSCHAVSLQDGVLTLGFYVDGYAKKTVETEHRERFEKVASEIIGSPVSIRCIIAPKPPAKLATKSPLVQHAVQNRGAKIIERES